MNINAVAMNAERLLSDVHTWHHWRKYIAAWSM